MKKENVFKEKLYQHTIPVRDGLWEAIEAQLPAKKDQRIFPVFWFTLFGATLLGGVLMLGVFNQRNLEAVSPVTNAAHITAASNQNAQEHATHQSSLESGTTSATTASPASPAHDSNLSDALNQNSNPTRVNSTSNKGNKAIVKPSGNTIPATGADAEAMSSQKNNVADPGPVALTVYPATSALRPSSVSSVSFLPSQEVYIESATESALPGIGFLKPDPNCYKFSGTGSKLVFSADVFAGPGFSPKSYDQKSSEASIYADARRATENNQYAWSAGARFNLQHRSGLTGRIGINYTQVGDVFDYTDSLATQSTTRIDSFFAADGTFLYTETSQVLILGTLIKKIHNTYRYLDIPVIVGYEMPMGRSTILVNAGPVFNLTSSHEGQILDPSLHPRSITAGDPGAIDVYKTNLGLSIYLGAGYLFPISDHFSGLIEPSFTYRLKPVTLDTYPLQENRHYAALNLGIRYHFH